METPYFQKGSALSLKNNVSIQIIFLKKEKFGRDWLSWKKNSKPSKGNPYL